MIDAPVALYPVQRIILSSREACQTKILEDPRQLETGAAGVIAA